MEVHASWLSRLFGPKREWRVAARVDPASASIELEGGEAVQPPLVVSARVAGGRCDFAAVKETVHE